MRDYRWWGPLVLFSLSFIGALGAMAVLSRDDDPAETRLETVPGQESADAPATDAPALVQRAGFGACIDAVMVDLSLKRPRDIRYAAGTAEACGLSSSRSR